MRDLGRLPKAHLHLHLEGAMRPGTVAELADRAGATVPSWRPGQGFAAFLTAYAGVVDLITTADDLRRIMREVAEDAAADGAVWVEPHVHPPIFAGRFGPDDDTLDLLLEAARDASLHAGIGVGLVVSADREGDASDALALAELAADRATAGVVAFGLVGNEDGFPPEPFAEAFMVADEAGLLCVPHAGELLGPSSVRAAVDQLGARRVAHGVRAAEDPALVQRLASEGICLDVCPTSNVSLGVVPELDEHPLPELLDAGVPISLNADDPLFFGASLLDEYTTCRDVFAFDDVALAELARASIEASAAPPGTKRDGVERLMAWLRSPPQPAAVS